MQRQSHKHAGARVAGDGPHRHRPRAPGAEVTNPPWGDGELAMLGHSFPKATLQTPKKLSSKLLLHFSKRVLICRNFLVSAKCIFNPTQKNC